MASGLSGNDKFLNIPVPLETITIVKHLNLAATKVPK